jgi:hypothetical protein
VTSSKADGADDGLPPGVAEARGLALLAETGDAILAAVDREAPRWVIDSVARLLDAWGGADALTRRRAIDAAGPAGAAAARRVGGSLAALLATDPSEQRSTPLEIVRTLYREPTAVLRAAGVPAVVRDPFDERARPEDRYDLAPRTLGDLGDPELGPLHLAWGVAKATVLRARTERESS